MSMKKTVLALVAISACSTPQIDRDHYARRMTAETLSENNLLYDEFYGDNFTEKLATFSESHCDNKRKKGNNSECIKQYNNMTGAKLSLRYPNADFELVKTECTADPDSCKGNGAELKLLRSHNEVILNSIIQEAKNEQAALNNAQAERSRRISGAFQQFGQSMQQPRQVTCTSRPDYMGGSTTVCN
jgi:hypothetical protein